VKKIDNIINRISKLIQKRRIKLVKRNLQFNNFETANSIGILFNVEDDIYFKKIKIYIDTFLNTDKKVFALGFVKNKEDIGQKYLYRKGVDFYSKSDINIFGKVKNSSVTDFINETPDILINLSFENNFCVEYVFSLSRANFKISGLDKCEHSDLRIDNKNNKDLDFLTNQIDNYLKKLKKV